MTGFAREMQTGPDRKGKALVAFGLKAGSRSQESGRHYGIACSLKAGATCKELPLRFRLMICKLHDRSYSPSIFVLEQNSH